MPLYSDEELEQFPEFEDLDEAVRNPEKVIRFRAYRCEDSVALARVAELHNLQSLSISLSDVSQLLPKLCQLKDLQNLYLQACKIPAFPDSILKLHNLRSLTIGNNSLQDLPDELGCLVKLEELRFPQNQLQRIPESIGKLTRLTTLGLSRNKLNEVPNSVGDLKELEQLFLDVNRLRHLPKAIGNLSHLRSLDLGYNELRTLPDSVCNLLDLESLSIEHNPFDSLPSCLSRMARIKTLSIEAGKRSLFMDWSYRHSETPPQIESSDLNLFVAPTSLLYDPLMATIREGGLSEAGPIILRAARDAVKIEATIPDDYSQPGNSRLGGFPGLLNPALFPKTDGLYWIFLAQINVADLAPLNGYLPRSGMLSFFLDSTEGLNGKVLFYQGDPRALITVRHGGADEMVAPDDNYTEKPHRVKFERIFSLPHDPPDGIQDDRAYEAYEKCEALHECVDHHINGYTFTQLESPQQQAADKLRGQPEEWVPLLQLGWDARVGFCFWDAGTLTFTIHREDLRRWDFSRVHVSLESP